MDVADRTALTRYMSPAAMRALVQAVTNAAAVYKDAVSSAEPIKIDEQNLGAVVAALGMDLKLTAAALGDASQRVEALGVTSDCADAVTGLGAALRDADDTDEIEVGGSIFERIFRCRAVSGRRSEACD